MILGLTGSFGSGKSTVAQMLTDLAQARVIDADALARDLQLPGRPGHRAIVEEFGPGILTDSGELNRPELAKRVFGNEAELQRLNALIHPLVWDEEVRLLEKYKEEPLVVLMVPLLFETDAHTLCDKVAVVSVDEVSRTDRLARRDGVTPEQVQRRLAAQMDQAAKEQRADFVIRNGGSLEETQAQVRDMLATLGLLDAPGSREKV